MSSITTNQDLLKEKQKLTLLLDVQRELIATNFQELKVELQPLSTVFSFIKKLTTRGHGNELLQTGVSIAADVVLKKFILARGGWITKLILPFIVKNLSSHYLDSGKGMLQSLIGKFIKSRQKA